MKWWANRTARAANWNTPAEQQRAMFRMQMTIGAILGFLLPLNVRGSLPFSTSLPLLLATAFAFYLAFRKSGARGFFVGIGFGVVMLSLARWVGGHMGAT